MLAFAANSLLCRLALGEELIDAVSFTGVRVVSGALLLAIMVLPRWRTQERSPVNWLSVATLFTYMACFSLAYLSLDAGTGALILFGAVQLTMFLFALSGGERFPLLSWIGLSLAILGLLYLVSPGLTAPDPIGALLMATAGIAWGGYSLLGRGVADPLKATAANFIYSVPLIVVISLFFVSELQATFMGILLAATSGAITSGLGYAVWYAALPGLTATRAATVQLSVPAIAAIGGVVLLSEPITWRLFLSSAATLGGVAIVLSQRVEKASRR